MFRIARHILFVFLLVFILPALVHTGLWAAQDRPHSWRDADWSSAGIFPPASQSQPAHLYIMAARTGGLKGAISVHTWIVTKARGATQYNRYDVVGWGRPVRKNGYDADARWYSNTPRIIFELSGKQAEITIPKIEAAISTYHWRKRGDYTIWPGPNSNTFVANIIRAVPELKTALPSTAIGKDLLAGSKWFQFDASRGSVKISAAGYAGLTLGWAEGLEINILGLVVGIGFNHPGIKLPGFGLLSFS